MYVPYDGCPASAMMNRLLVELEEAIPIIWNRQSFAYEVRTPLVYGLPFGCLLEEMGSACAHDAFRPEQPVITLPGALHGAIGRALVRAERNDLFKRSRLGPNGKPQALPPPLLLEPPSVSEKSDFSYFAKSARRTVGPGWKPPEDWVAYGEGESFDFGVRIFEPRPESERTISIAVVDALREGVGGRLISDRRATLRLRGGKSERESRWPPPSEAQRIRVAFFSPFVREGGIVRGNGKRDAPINTDPPDFEELWKAVRLRLYQGANSLIPNYGRPEVVRAIGLPERMADLRVRLSDAENFAQVWRLHFDRKNQDPNRPLFGEGFSGAVEYVGPLSGFLPWLRLAGELGVGEWTQIGLGRFRVLVVE